MQKFYDLLCHAQRRLEKIIRIMKLTAGLILFAIITASGVNTYSQNARLSLNLKNATIVDIFREIERTSEFGFFFKSEEMNLEKRHSINVSNASIDEVLKAVLDENYSYKILDKNIVVTKGDLVNAIQQQQGKKISGKVTNQTGASMPGASVAVKGTTIGVITDINGYYTLVGVPEKGTLRFSFVGMKSQEVSIAGKSTVNIILTDESVGLNEVVTIAFGTVRKKDLTGSISTVDSKLISSESNSSLSQALEGAAAGVQVSSIDGQPGLDMGIRIRGLGTASQNNANALIVIDGVPSSQTNVLSIINPNDVESMTILKDGASTALWGSRGANGVVMVTTKKGKLGKVKITYDGRVGINQEGPFADDKISNPKDYYEYAWLSIYNAARFKSATKYTTNVQNPNMTNSQAATFASTHLFDYTGSTTSFSRNDLGNWMLYNVPGATYTPTGSGASASSDMNGAYLVGLDGKLNPNAKLLYHDSYDKYFFENKFRQEHNLSASGASEKIDYFMSLGYLQNPSYITGSKFGRYNFRSNVNAQITRWLKTGVNAAYSHRDTQSPATRYGRNAGSAVANVFAWADQQNQLTPLFQHNLDGSYILDSKGNKIVNSAAGQSPSPLGPTSGPLSTADLTYILANDKDETISHDLNIRGYVEAKFLKEFTFNANLSSDNSFSTRQRYWNNTSGSAVSYGGALGETYSEIDNLNSQQVLNWAHNTGKSHYDAMIGHEFNNYHDFSLNYKGSYSLIPNFASFSNFVGLNSGSIFAGTGGSENKVNMEGYFGRANYIYDEKYYAQASIRRDGSSKFKYDANRWGTFGSVGGGWRISKEKWMSDISFVNDLKLRGSFGIIGNQNGINNYSGYQTWALGASSYTYSGASYSPSTFTLSKGAYVNDGLTWEKVHAIDGGVDFRLWDRFYGNIDYYQRDTYDMVWSQSLAWSLGQASLDRNNAKLRNRGFEIELGVDIIKTADLHWSFSVNATHYRTILESVPAGTGVAALNGNWTATVDGWSSSGTGAASGISYLRGIGKDYYNMYFYKYAGVDQSTGLPLFYHQITASDAGTYPGAKVGSSIKTTDYSQASRYEMGSATPDVIGGFSTTAHYKNFDLGVTCAYQLGGKFMSVEYANGLYRSETIGGVVSKDLIGNTWTPENKKAKFPMQMYTGDQYGNGATLGSWAYTDMSLFSASYLSIKNLTIGYTLPQKYLSKLELSVVRLYCSVDNAWMFTAHPGFDPRMSLAGGLEVGAYAYPYMRTKSIGITVTF